MFNHLESLCTKGTIRQLDYQFAKFIHSIEIHHTDEVGFIAGVLSYELSKGHICINIYDFNVMDMLDLHGIAAAETLRESIQNIDWLTILNNASVIGVVSVDGKQKHHNKPLIFDGQRLYLQRYWYYEQFLADKLNQLAEPIIFTEHERHSLFEHLNNLFPNPPLPLNEPNWQKVAVAVALSRRLSVISGGPGTGKTTTVVKLLAALIGQGVQQNDIKLVAPTGKAAARLTESIGSAVQAIVMDEKMKSQIPTNASTIHRLLGARSNQAEFRHNRNNPLHLDLLVVDEASMVDLSLMSKLLDALPEKARLILLGDKDQLASVEAGAVLGDICAFIEHGYSEGQAKLLSELTGYAGSFFEKGLHCDMPDIDRENINVSAKVNTSKPSTNKSHINKRSANRFSDSLCMLRKSYRFDEHSGIGVLAKAINMGEVADVVSVLEQNYQDIHYHPLNTESYEEMIILLASQYAKYLQCVAQAVDQTSQNTDKRALEALSLFASCRLLCAVREGDFGLSGLNHRIESVLKKKRLIPTTDEMWYLGRPVMITRNDHALGLFNGDIGITMLVSDYNEKGEVERYFKVFFELPDGSVKSVLPSRIPEHDTAYAMTIHKSQGSEFSTTVMILPSQSSLMLTKELIYTGVTRAKTTLHIYADRNVLLKGITTKTERRSGLKEKLAAYE